MSTRVYGVTRMREDLLVLFEPCVHRLPSETDCVAQLFERRLLVVKSWAGRLLPSGSHREAMPITAAGRVNDVVLS
jgi:hypothetical protein